MADDALEKVAGSHDDPPNVLVALILTLIFALANFQLSHTAPGHWLEFKAYDALRSVLPDLDKDMPIVRVDISSIPSDSNNLTSRPMLRSVVDQIVNVPDDQKPAAIGLDVDFSPEEGRHATQDTQDLLDYCKGVSAPKNPPDNRKLVPIFLGVGRTAYNAPEDWFGYTDSSYFPMAVNILVNPSDTHQTARWTYDADGKLYGSRKMLPSMAQALSGAYLNRHLGEEHALPIALQLLETIPSNPLNLQATRVGGTEDDEFARDARTEVAPGLVEGVSLVSYSKLDQIRQQPVRVVMRNGLPVLTGDFAGKMVLLGDTALSDVFTIPGPIKPLKGIYLHACAAYTFVREPLYNLKEIWRFTLDVLLSIVLVTLLTGIHYQLKAHPRRERIKNLAHYGLLVLVLGVGSILVRITGIMWFDFIAIVIALRIHPDIEHFIDHMAKKLTGGHTAAIPDRPDTDVPTTNGD